MLIVQRIGQGMLRSLKETAVLKSDGTRLSTIHSHELRLHCACGRSASLRVQDLLALKSPPKTVGDVVAKARCSGCGQVDVQLCQIVYEGPVQSERPRGSEGTS